MTRPAAISNDTRAGSQGTLWNFERGSSRGRTSERVSRRSSLREMVPGCASGCLRPRHRACVVAEKRAQSPGQGTDPMAHAHRWQHALLQVHRRVGHAPAEAARAEAASCSSAPPPPSSRSSGTRGVDSPLPKSRSANIPRTPAPRTSAARPTPPSARESPASARPTSGRARPLRAGGGRSRRGGECRARRVSRVPGDPRPSA
jgi:hypothetical protein